ncbi:MAG: DUF1634 domain-containing protein [Bacillota bacterium]
MAVPQVEKRTTETAPEQVVYANILNIGMIMGIVLLVITFLVYVSGMLKPLVPPEQVPSLWGGKAHEYVVATGAPTGWGWLSYLNKGDYVNFIGIALLSLLTILGYLVLLPAYIRKKEGIYSLLVIAEIIVLGLAAAGVVGGGGH